MLYSRILKSRPLSIRLFNILGAEMGFISISFAKVELMKKSSYMSGILFNEHHFCLNT
jgi:hypothetical protein